jgi:hypothetical protein
MSAYCPEGTGTCADAEAGPCVLGLPCDYWRRQQGRELALLLADGTVIRDPSWRCVADVHGSFHGFVQSGGRTYGVIVDAETLVQVYPPLPTD